VAAGKLCGSWQAVAVGKLWQLAICTPLASCVAVGKLCCSGQAMAVGDLYTISETATTKSFFHLRSYFLLPWYSLTTAYLTTVNLFFKLLDKPKDIDEKGHSRLEAAV
jgi:hypothetical protein